MELVAVDFNQDLFELCKKARAGDEQAKFDVMHIYAQKFSFGSESVTLEDAYCQLEDFQAAKNLAISAKITGQAYLEYAFDDLFNELDPYQVQTFEEFEQALKALDPNRCEYYHVAVCAAAGDPTKLKEILTKAHDQFIKLHTI